MKPSRMDDRCKEYVAPTRLVWQTLGSSKPKNPELLIGNTRIQPTTAQRPSSILYNNGPHSAILLDYGQEMHGGITLVTGKSSTRMPVRMRVRFGESVSEAMTDMPGTMPGRDHKNDHAIRDAVIRVPQLGTAELGPTGFRFVRIDLEEPNTWIELQAVPAVSIYRNIERTGSFHCSDDRLNEIWETGARTVHLNMQTHLWDGIKRDRLVWIGDMHPETDVISTVFGHHPIVESSLELTRDDFALPGWMNNISSYSLWWIIIQHDWFLYQGSHDYLEEQRDYLCALLRQTIAQIDWNGFENLGGHRFLDWPSSGDKDALHQGLHALLAIALDRGAVLCETLAEYRLAILCRKARLRLLQARPSTSASKQSAALALLAGTAQDIKAVQECLLADGAQGISTFYGYYVLEALAKLGCYREAMALISAYWGGMLDLGATSFWEHFDLTWKQDATRIDELPRPDKHDIHAEYGEYCYTGHRHSLCHGWAAGPTAWLSRHVLGVQPLEPGCRAISITPHLEQLDWAHGTFPTPLGPVKVSHERTMGENIHTTVHVPKDMRVEF